MKTYCERIARQHAENRIFFFVFRFLFCVLLLSECMSVLSINVDVGSVRNKGHFSSVDDSHLIHRQQYTAELMS